MYAVIETGGKQLKVSEGETVLVEKLDGEVGSDFVFDKVMGRGSITLACTRCDAVWCSRGGDVLRR